MNEENNLNNQVGTTPVEPVAPQEPVAPVQPTEPVAPVEPVTPVAPVQPVQPVQPVAPVAPQPGVPPVAPQVPLQQPQPQKSGGGFYIIAAILVVAIIALVVVLVIVLGKKDGNGGTTTTTATTTGSDNSTTTVLQSSTISSSTMVITTNPNTTTVARTTTSPSTPNPTPVGGNNGQVTVNDISFTLPANYEVYKQSSGVSEIVNKTKKIELIPFYHAGYSLSDAAAESSELTSKLQSSGYTVAGAGQYSYGGRDYYLFISSLSSDTNYGYIYGFTKVGSGLIEFNCRASRSTEFEDIMYDVTILMNSAKVSSTFAPGGDDSVDFSKTDVFDTRILN